MPSLVLKSNSGLLNISAGTDLTWKGKKIAELYITADNLLNRAYQSHLSRLKYADMNSVTSRQGVFNMGRNIKFKVVVPGHLGPVFCFTSICGPLSVITGDLNTLSVMSIKSFVLGNSPVSPIRLT